MQNISARICISTCTLASSSQIKTLFMPYKLDINIGGNCLKKSEIAKHVKTFQVTIFQTQGIFDMTACW